MNPEYIAFFGLFMGVLTRMALPYIRKRYQNGAQAFDDKYLVSGIFGVFFAFIVTFMLGPDILIVSVDGTISILRLIWVNWLVGFGTSAVVNELLAWGKPKTP